MTEEQIMKNAGIRVTAVRMLIWRTICREFHGIFNLADLEEELPTVDKSTLFRTLNLLSEHHLLDTVNDVDLKHLVGNLQSLMLRVNVGEQHSQIFQCVEVDGCVVDKSP